MHRFDRELAPAIKKSLIKDAMELTKQRVLQLISSSAENGINDHQISNQLSISLDEARFHMEELHRAGFIKRIPTPTYLEGEGSCHALSVTSRGKMLLKGKISFDDGLTSNPHSQVVNVNNHASVATQQFGNNNTANVTQNIGSDAAEIFQMLDALRQDVSNLPPERQIVALEALEDIEDEVKTPTKASRIRGGLLALWSVTKDIASFANAVTALAQRFSLDQLLS